MDLVHFTHDATGLSYASSIAAITVGIRLFIILPFGIMSLRTDPTIEEDIKRLKQKIETTKNTTVRNALIDHQKELSQRAKKQNRVRVGMPIASLGTFLLMWSGLRYMAVYYPQDLAAGGMLWFVDLTQRDPLIFLPVLSTITFYLMGEVNADQLGKPTRELSPKWRMFWRTFRATALLFLWDAPAAIFCYWLPNSTMSLAQAVILSQPPVRRALGIASEEEIRRVKKANAIEFVDESPMNQQSSSRENGVDNAQKEIAQNISLRKRRKGGKRKR
jgi:YidC/Oxa1 family membrane protein insertase